MLLCFAMHNSISFSARFNAVALSRILHRKSNVNFHRASGFPFAHKNKQQKLTRNCEYIFTVQDVLDKVEIWDLKHVCYFCIHLWLNLIYLTHGMGTGIIYSRMPHFFDLQWTTFSQLESSADMSLGQFG